MVSVWVLLVRSTLAFIEKHEHCESRAMLAVFAACIVAAVLLLNLCTVLSVATVILPPTQWTIRGSGAVLGAALALTGAWTASYALVRHVLRADRERGCVMNLPDSPQLIIGYAIVSVAAWFISVGLLALRWAW